MDFLKRELAPITKEAWKVIDEEAVKTLKGRLSARKILDFKGPFGWEYASAPDGRLSISDRDFVEGVSFGKRLSQPIIEFRVPFSLDIWELDDISRGSDTTCFEALYRASEKAALFEEKAIYKGLPEGCIKGLEESSEHEPISMTISPDSIMEAMVKAISTLKDSSVEGPYTLICEKKLWQAIMTSGGGYPLKKRINSLSIDIELSPVVDSSILISKRGGDVEFILGQDMSIGYEGASDKKANFFITESFTVRILGPDAFIPLKIN